MSFESDKNLGGIGSLLMVVSPVGMGIVSGALFIVGLILLLVALKGMADHYKDKGIFDNALYAFIAAVVGIVAGVIVVVVTALATLTSLGLDLFNVSNWSQWGQAFGNMMNFNVLWTLLGGIIVGLVVLFVFAIIAALLVRRSLNALSEKTKVEMFGTAGLIMLIGAVLTIIVVGFLLIWVSFILLTVAFFSIKSK